MNPNFARRRGPALALTLAYPAVKAACLLLAAFRPRPRRAEGVAVFQAYQVGDCYMALPALLRLARNMPVTVICRPDCVFLLEASGLKAVAFDNAFWNRASPATLGRSLRAAWALRRRGLAGMPALDLDADPRTAVFLKVAGLGPSHAYRRPYGWFFERVFPLPGAATARHQQEKNQAVVEAFLATRGQVASPPTPAHKPQGPNGGNARPRGFVLSCWTRKDTKNWPLENWDAVLECLLARGETTAVISPPDGDAAFARFRERWRGRAEFLETDLAGVHARVRDCAGVVCSDNFIGHMAAWLGKPVLWINGSSDPEHVAPRGATRIVQLEPMPCRPCGHRCVNPEYKECLVRLKPETVVAALQTWLLERSDA